MHYQARQFQGEKMKKPMRGVGWAIVMGALLGLEGWASSCFPFEGKEALEKGLRAARALPFATGIVHTFEGGAEGQGSGAFLDARTFVTAAHVAVAPSSRLSAVSSAQEWETHSILPSSSVQLVLPPSVLLPIESYIFENYTTLFVDLCASPFGRYTTTISIPSRVQELNQHSLSYPPQCGTHWKKETPKSEGWRVELPWRWMKERMRDIEMWLS